MHPVFVCIVLCASAPLPPKYKKANGCGVCTPYFDFVFHRYRAAAAAVSSATAGFSNVFHMNQWCAACERIHRAAAAANAMATGLLFGI